MCAWPPAPGDKAWLPCYCPGRNGMSDSERYLAVSRSIPRMPGASYPAHSRQHGIRHLASALLHTLNGTPRVGYSGLMLHPLVHGPLFYADLTPIAAYRLAGGTEMCSFSLYTSACARLRCTWRARRDTHLRTKATTIRRAAAPGFLSTVGWAGRRLPPAVAPCCPPQLIGHRCRRPPASSGFDVVG